MKGSFVVFEGIDGAGTTTQSTLLQSWMTDLGHRTRLTREPSDGPIGSLIRLILKGRVVGRSSTGEPVNAGSLALLFAADRLDHLDSMIIPNLDSGTHVISDRYVASSLAYQSIDLDLSWVKSVNLMARQPDLTIFLRVPANVAVERIMARQGNERDLYETLATLEKVAERYELLFTAKTLTNVVELDGGQPIPDLAAEIRRIIRAQVLDVTTTTL